MYINSKCNNDIVNFQPILTTKLCQSSVFCTSESTLLPGTYENRCLLLSE